MEKENSVIISKTDTFLRRFMTDSFLSNMVLNNSHLISIDVFVDLKGKKHYAIARFYCISEGRYSTKNHY